MTLDEFFGELAQCAAAFDWRAHSPDLTPLGLVRGRCDDGDVCPITAVYFARRAEYVDPPHFDRAATELGLSREDAVSIIAAADGWNLMPRSATAGPIRRRLCAALQLPSSEAA